MAGAGGAGAGAAVSPGRCQALSVAWSLQARRRLCERCSGLRAAPARVARCILQGRLHSCTEEKKNSKTIKLPPPRCAVVKQGAILVKKNRAGSRRSGVSEQREKARLWGGCQDAAVSAIWRRRRRAEREGGRRCGEQGCPPWRLTSTQDPDRAAPLKNFRTKQTNRCLKSV